ncbi:hypothetical protein BG005_003700, partial [Podila minutissima]
MTEERLSLFCLVDGLPSSRAFPIKATFADTVGDLKDLIKAHQTPAFDDITPDQLNLWRVSIPYDKQGSATTIGALDDKTELNNPRTRLSKLFPESPDDNTYIIVQRPVPVHAPVPARVSTPLSGYLSDNSRPGTPLSGDLRVDIKKIADKFFATGSKHADFLDNYVQGQLALPITTTGVRGLPKVVEHFIERAGWDAGTGSAGIRGCGKTRSMIEMLCLQWGFYFNAAKSDLGSDDLSLVAELLDKKTLEEQGPRLNTVFARNTTLVLFLSRLLVLKYCLHVPNCRQTFSSASWAILQVCPQMFQDVFSELFRVLFGKLHERAYSELVLMTVVRDEFLSVRERLAARGYPNFSTNTKLRLVVDEAQILSDRGSTSFVSSSTQGDLRPMLSPILHGFRTTGDRGELTIIYCGTGLSIRTLHWAMSSGDGIKEYGSSTFPYVEFPGWTGPDSVQSYVDRMKEQLSDDGSKRLVDALIPTAAVDMLHKRLTGRFRPIVTAIEGIIKTGEPREWETVINNTEVMITAWKDRKRRGNLCGELDRLESKIADHPELFTSCSSLRETLGLFLYRYCLLDATEIVLENEIQLVEAAFGRIKIFGGTARTVLDEPF